MVRKATAERDDQWSVFPTRPVHPPVARTRTHARTHARTHTQRHTCTLTDTRMRECRSGVASGTDRRFGATGCKRAGRVRSVRLWILASAAHRRMEKLKLRDERRQQRRRRQHHREAQLIPTRARAAPCWDSRAHEVGCHIVQQCASAHRRGTARPDRCHATSRLPTSAATLRIAYRCATDSKCKHARPRARVRQAMRACVCACVR